MTSAKQSNYVVKQYNCDVKQYNYDVKQYNLVTYILGQEYIRPVFFQK